MFNVIAIFVLGMLIGMNTEYQRAMALFHREGRIEEAVAEYERGIAECWPDYCFWRDYGTALCYADRPLEGLAAFDRSLAVQDDAETKYRKGCMMLMHGQWEPGWRCLESRLSLFPIHGPTKPWWGGEQVNGRLGIYCEGAYGDWFQFTRYIVGARDTVSRFVMLDNKADSKADVYTSLMSLPLATGLLNPSDAQQPPYIYTEPELRDKWARELSAIDGLKVGICWQGNPAGGQERSIPLRQFLTLAEIPHVRIISLQKVRGTEQLQDASGIVSLPLDVHTKPFVDTGAVITNLDLVITCDTSIAHLAGGLNKPVWVALSALPDWRFGLKGESTPWYPSMRLFRQQRIGDWSTVFHGIETELRRIAG